MPSKVPAGFCFPVCMLGTRFRSRRSSGSSTGGSCVGIRNADSEVPEDDDRLRNAILGSGRFHFSGMPAGILVFRCLFGTSL